jgi:hypothetical protein
MFENIEIRKVSNGYILCITNDQGDTREYVYDTARKLLRVLKQHLDATAAD